MTGFVHVLLTRFNMPGFIGTDAPSVDWLTHRCNLFERVCLPSVRGQSVQSFRWLILFANSTPALFRERIRTWAEWKQLTPCFLDSYADVDPVALIRSRVRADASHLITSRLDNDDGLAVDFVEKVQLRFQSQHCQLLNFDHGVILADGCCYFSHHRSNPFLSLIEDASSPRTVWCDEHQRLAHQLPTDHIAGPPMWIQTIHSHNASNALGLSVRLPRRQVESRFDIDRSLLRAESRLGVWSANARVRTTRSLRRLRRLLMTSSPAGDPGSKVRRPARLPEKLERLPSRRTFFTVIVPTRNRPRLLERALASLRNQTWQDFEVRVVDDGSCDSGAVTRVIDRCDDDRFQLQRLERNRGVSAARNQGVATAVGEWITFLDDDDELRANALQEIHCFLASRPELGFTWASVRRKYDDEGHFQDIVWSDEETQPLAHLGAGTGYALTVHREAIEAIGGFDESIQAGVDFELLIRLGQRFRGAPVPQVLVEVHFHSADQITDATLVKAEAFLQILEKHRRFFACHPLASRPFLLKTARLCRGLGMRRESRRVLLRALKASPWHLATWKTILFLEMRRESRRSR